MIGLEDHGHSAAFDFGVALDFGMGPKLFFDLLEDVAAEIEVGHLAATELERELNLITFFKKLFGVIDLDHEVVIADFDGFEFEFFELAGAGAGAGLVFFLLLLVSPLAVIHYAADRGTGGGSNLDKIKARLTGALKSFGCLYRPHFVVGFVDQKNRRDFNLLIVAKIGRNGLGLQKTIKIQPWGGKNGFQV